MAKRGDEVKVGVMVMGVGAILIVTVFMMIRYNPFQPAYDEYLIHLKFAGGLERDSIVRFGGMKRGKVVSMRLAPGTAPAVEIQLSLQRGTPIKTDSVARLAALNALGENYIEITMGREDSPLLAPGQIVRSEETPEFSELLAKINGLSEEARLLVGDLGKKLNRISDSADTLLANLSDATGPANRKALASILERTNGTVANANDLISRNSPKVDAVAANLQSASAKLSPLMQRVDEAAVKMNTLLERLDGTVAENRPQLKKDLEALELTLADARRLLNDFTTTLEANRDDIDAIMENFRRSSENLQEFTNTIRQQPFSLFRIKAMPDRRVPNQEKR
jgi:phospholipid/cholesterol/gamma-HCH transport system substrate-binding protein